MSNWIGIDAVAIPGVTFYGIYSAAFNFLNNACVTAEV